MRPSAYGLLFVGADIAAAPGRDPTHLLNRKKLGKLELVPEPAILPVISERLISRAHAMRMIGTMIDPDVDFRLQRAIDRRGRGVVRHLTADTTPDEVAVIVKVRDWDAFAARTMVRPGAVLGQDKDKAWLGTARIPLKLVEDVRRLEGVISISAAQRLRPMLKETLKETGARPDLLPPGIEGDLGQGSIVGVIDFGCDFAHKNFQNPNGTTRLRAIWNQRGESTPESPCGYGCVYRAPEINAALSSPQPYVTLGYGPSPGSHGTHVMDIAAGNGTGSGQAGVAANAEIIFVEVAAEDVPWSGPEVVGKNFGDSVQLLEAIQFILNEAGNLPCVINISLGTNGGPHDGTSLVEQGIDVFLADHLNRAIVIAASNSFDDHVHATGRVAVGQTIDVTWRIPNADVTFNEFELWYSGSDELEFEFLDPSGASVGTVNLGAPTQRLTDETGRVVALISHGARDPSNGDNTIGIFLERGLPQGDWTVRLKGKVVTNGVFHAWLERNDNGQSSFVGPTRDDAHTLGSISCSHLGISVGSYDAHRAGTPLSSFSSSGPTRDGRQKPEVSAPGHDVWAANATSGTGVIRMSGTSMASPAVTGIIALMLSEAASRGFNLSINDIRSILAEAARPGDGWDARYGHGRVDAAAAIARVIGMTPGS